MQHLSVTRFVRTKTKAFFQKENSPSLTKNWPVSFHYYKKK